MEKVEYSKIRTAQGKKFNQLVLDLENEILMRTYRLFSNIGREIQTCAEYVTYNLHFVGDARREIKNFFEKCTATIQALKDGNSDNTRSRTVQPDSLLTEINTILTELPHAISDSLLGIRKIFNLSGLLEVMDPRCSQRVLLDISNLIHRSLLLLEDKIRPETNVKVSLSEPCMPIYCYPFLLAHAIREILLNSLDAISEHQDNKTNQGSTIEISASANFNAQRVEIRISDTGTGIPENIRKRIFEPYFTTRAKKGLGLTISKWVIEEKHEGSLSIKSKEMEGTTATITLPII